LAAAVTVALESILPALRPRGRRTKFFVVSDAVGGVQAAKAAGCNCLGLTTSLSSARILDVGADWTAADLMSAPGAILDW
jgi:beta-phosphoglucomutase-like phosphatase (HAD superfamily)